MSSPQPNTPPPPNPFLSAYENFVQNTPFLTRTILTVQVLSYLFSWFVNPHLALANIPYFVLFRFEIYRVVLSPLVNTQLSTLIFAFLSFFELGKRLEYSMGTVAFGWFCAGVGLIANLGFLVISLLSYVLTGGDTGQLMNSADGIWLILFGAISTECIQAPAGLKRRFFFCEVPVQYYPVALYVLFAFLGGGFSVAYALSMGAGYLHGRGRLDHVLKLSNSKANEWENGLLANLSGKPGWVVSHAALGGDAWIQIHTSEPGLMTSSLFRPTQMSSDASGSPVSTAGSVAVAGSSRSVSSNNLGRSGTSSFPGSSGHTLGGSTNRRVTDARAARLQALERRGENAV